MQCDSSMTFWLRRCMLQSRTPGAHTVPYWSAISWTSTWRAPVTTLSMNTVGSPNALAPSDLALVERRGELFGMVDAPDAAPATASCGLDHQRVADPLGGPWRPDRPSRPDHRSRPPLVRRLVRPATWRRSCRRACASHPAAVRRRRSPAVHTARRTRGVRRRIPSRPRPRRRGPCRAPVRAWRGRGTDCRRSGRSAPSGSRQTASSASRTNIAARSAVVCRAMARQVGAGRRVATRARRGSAASPARRG